VSEAAPTRATPNYCPYCGETDIRPDEARGDYFCTICDRLWKLSFRGLARSHGGAA
jgi:hypothetical protein